MNDQSDETRAQAKARPESEKRAAELDIFGLVNIVWRGKWLIALTTIAGIFLGGYYAFVLSVPKYTASSVVMLERRQDNVVDLESVVSGLSGDQATINTEVEVIRSRGLVEKLITKLDLVADPEFNPTLMPRARFAPSQLMVLMRRLFEGERPPAPAPSDRMVLDATIDRVLAATTVVNLRQSYVFRISVVTTDGAKSAMMSDGLAELYILEQIQVKFDATKQATEWLSQRVTELQASLEKAEEEVKTFVTSSELVSPESLDGLNQQAKELRDRLGTTLADIEVRNVAIEILRNAEASGDIEQMAAAAKDPTLDRLRTMIANEGETARPSFEARFKLILNQAVTDRDRSVARTVSLRETVTTISNQIESQSADLVKLQQLQREAEASRLIYEYFLNRLKETSVQQGIQQADSRLLSQAVVPTRASEPNKSFVLALGALAGAFVGFAMILVFELRFKGFRTAESLEQATGITVMGQIPKIPARRRSNVLAYLSEKPNSTAAEAIRNLRTSIVLSNVDNPPKVIMSTSSLPGEGKTTQSLALAQNFANIGKKVLLVEGDIRRQVFSQYFQIEQKKGLVSVISGDVTLKDAVVRNELMDVDILFGETAEVNAADLFSSEKFRSLIAAMRRDYDIVIIDTPPTLVVPDARVIGQNVDGILYTVKWDSTTHLQVQEGIRMLETVNLKVMGLVLGQIDSRGMRRYGYGGQYGGYGSYANYGSKYHEN